MDSEKIFDLNTPDDEIKAKFYALKSFEDLASLLEIKSDYLTYLLYRLPIEQRYTTFEIPKKSGGVRVIANPQKQLKIIQKKLHYILSLIYKARCSTMGFRKKSSILDNANRHSLASKTKIYKRRTKLKYVFNIDLEDFFPSIHFGRIRGLFLSRPYQLPQQVATVIAQICTYENGLPQGAPTSPILSNMICNQMDSQLQRLAQKKRCTYTRYADDITFSTNLSTFPRGIAIQNTDGTIELGNELATIIESNGFKVNEKKTRLQLATQRQEITGLIVNQFPNVRRSYIREIRAILHHWSKTDEETALKKYLCKHKKHRYPGKKPLTLRQIMRGKIEFLGMIRGRNDPIYRRYGLELENLDDTYVFKGNRTEEGEGEVEMSDASAKIFLSYAREDEIEVKKIYNRLKKVGFEPWMDQMNIFAGEDWERAIKKAQENADIFIFCCSKNSAEKRGFIQVEIRQALELAKRRLAKDIYIIPLLLEEGVEIPESVDSYQALKYFEDNGWNRLTQSIQEAIKRLNE